MICRPQDSHRSVSENSRQPQARFLGAVDGYIIARIGMAHDAGRRIVPENAFQPARRIV